LGNGLTVSNGQGTVVVRLVTLTRVHEMMSLDGAHRTQDCRMSDSATLNLPFDHLISTLPEILSGADRVRDDRSQGNEQEVTNTGHQPSPA
jgi:hypothetical protein